jgi:hypothetical protein
VRAKEFIIERHANEVDPDFIYDLVTEFEGKVEARGCCNEVYSEHQGEYVHLFIGGYSEDGFSEAVGREIAKELDAEVRPHHWFVSKCEFKLYTEAFGEAPDPEGATPQIMCFIDIFPMHGADEPTYGETVYHVCRAQDVASIEKHGLQPRTGSDHIQTANGRIYVCLRYDDIPVIADDFGKNRKWERGDLHVFAIDTSLLDNRWYRDVELNGTSAWTPDPIPASALGYLGPVKV